jgi:hypothetical protein
MKRNKIDNFKVWREHQKAIGKIKSIYPSFVKNGDLAELIGVILGDGNLEKYPRAERLTISSNSRNHGFIERYVDLINKVVKKDPTVKKQKTNCVKIYLYEKYLSKRLGISTGNRENIDWKTPVWIWKKREYLIRYLRGLYEAEGNLSIHNPTYTYKMFFANHNQSLLNSVYDTLLKLGFGSVHLEKHRVTISKKVDVFRLKDLIKYRHY